MGQKRQGRAKEEQPLMTAADVRCAGRIMDSTNPFPGSEVSMATPLMWKVAVALGRATSLHPSCVYVHIMILIAHTLDAVQIKYGPQASQNNS